MGCEINVTVSQSASGGDTPVSNAKVSWSDNNGGHAAYTDPQGSVTITLTGQTETLVSVSAAGFEGQGKTGFCNVPLLFELTEQVSGAGGGGGSSSPKGPLPTDPNDIVVAVHGYSVELSWKAGANSTLFEFDLILLGAQGPTSSEPKGTLNVSGGVVAMVGQAFSQTFTLGPGLYELEITAGNGAGGFSPGAVSANFQVVVAPAAPGSAVTCLYANVSQSNQGALDEPGSRVYYLVGNNHVDELAWTGWSEGPWVPTDTGAAARGGSALTSLYTGSDGSRVYYLDANGHVMELAWTGSGWKTTDTGSVAHSGSSLTCLYAGSNGSRVYYLDTQGHLKELAWNGSSWQFTDTGAVPQSGSALTCLYTSGDESRVYYIGANDHVFEQAWTGSGWQTTDTNAVAHSGSALTCLYAGSNGSRVYYLNANDHVMELAWTGSGWQVTDTGSVSQSGGSLTCLDAGSFGSRVYYLDTQGHLKELAWTGSGWKFTDTGAVPQSGTALSCYWTESSGSRVYGVTSKNTIGELAWTGSNWQWTDLG